MAKKEELVPEVVQSTKVAVPLSPILAANVQIVETLSGDIANMFKMANSNDEICTKMEVSATFINPHNGKTRNEYAAFEREPAAIDELIDSAEDAYPGCNHSCIAPSPISIGMSDAEKLEAIRKMIGM